MRLVQHHRTGFTLIELMVVMALVAIMTAMIIPQMKGTYEDALLRSASRKLIAVFSLANSRAITLNKMHRVRLDRKTGRYIVERRAGEGEGRSAFVSMRDMAGGEGTIDTRILIEFRKVDNDPRDAIAQPVGTAFADDPTVDGRNEISFYPDGTADEWEVMLRDREGFRIALHINPITARVQIVEPERP